MTLSRPQSVLIVDDHAEFGAFVHTLLEAEGWEVVGEAADAGSAIDAVHALAPELVLLDIQLPDRDGIEVAEELAREPSPPAVVLMSSREASDYGARLSGAPACGFLPKTALSGAALASLAAARGRVN
jgi:two-component system, NarL family, nitrate/nitrite response regulator NarL